jgi:hypothetical protein
VQLIENNAGHEAEAVAEFLKGLRQAPASH